MLIRLHYDLETYLIVRLRTIVASVLINSGWLYPLLTLKMLLPTCKLNNNERMFKIDHF